MKILSLPPEIQIQIFEYLSWLDHFTLSTASPIFTSVLQHNSFRRKRYCEEIWDNYKDIDVLDINFRRFLPDERRYWPDGPGWRTEVGLHGLLASGRFILKLERGGKRSYILYFRDITKRSKDQEEESDPMTKGLTEAWGGIKMVDISLDLLAGDPQYLNGHGLDIEARIETDESEKGENADGPGKGKDTGDTSSRAGLSEIGALDFFQDSHPDNPIEQASEVKKVSVFDMLGTYPQIFRVKRPIKLVDGQITSYSRSADIYWSIHIPWNGPCTPVKDIVESVAAAVTEEILEQNGELLGCWVRFSEYNFFPRADENDRVHPRWKVFLDLLVVKDPSSCSSPC